jgi:hypothetical protein
MLLPGAVIFLCGSLTLVARLLEPQPAHSRTALLLFPAGGLNTGGCLAHREAHELMLVFKYVWLDMKREWQVNKPECCHSGEAM